MVRESPYSNTYYTSTDPTFGIITFDQFIETEVEERGNYTQADVQRWAIKYHISPGDKVIWVSPKKWVANRYNLFAEEWDTAENIPESEMEVYEIIADDGFIIPESDDGDEGYLFVFRRTQNYMIGEARPTPKKEPWQMTSSEFYTQKYWYDPKRGKHPASGSGRLPTNEVPYFEQVSLGNKPLWKVYNPYTKEEVYYEISDVEKAKAHYKNLHRETIKKALKEGKPVPPEVLIEYPDLIKEKKNIGGTGMYPTPGVSTTPKVFTYFFRNRPPDIGTYPKGAVMKEAWLPMRKTPKGNMAFGWVSYERELTPEEISNYELFVDETVMPKLVAELIKYTHDEGISEGYKELFSKTGGWSEYGHALMDWLKANNEWKPDKGEQAEFLRHLARLTGVTGAIGAVAIKSPETRIEWQKPTKEAGYMPTQEDYEKARLFLSAIPRFTLDELIQQEATVRRWSIRFPDMEKELEDEYKLYLELRRAEKATAEAARKEKASKPQSEQAKELYRQTRKTNSVRELDDWRNRVLFEAHLPDVEEDILLRDLAAKWRIYLETRGIPAIEKLDKLPLDYKNEDYYFGTEVWIHPTTTMFDDQPLRGKLHQALNEGQLFEVAIEGREGTQRTQIERIYVTKVVEKPEPRYQPPAKITPPVPMHIQLESTEALYKRYTSGYSTVSFLGIVRQDTKDLAHSIGYELKLDTTIYTPAVLLRYAEQFKELAQRDYDREHQKYLARKEKEEAEKEKERVGGGQAFWDEVKNQKVVDFEVQHDINPDKPSRNYYHVYDRVFAILENGKKVQISYDIYKGEEGKRAAKATKEFYRKFYDQYIGKPLSEWVTEYSEGFIRTNMEYYRSQQPKPRFTFIPEVPVPPVPSQIAGKKVQSPEEIKREIVFSIQDAKTIEELQQIKTQIPFLPLPESEKRQITEQLQRRYSAITGEIPFGVPIKRETEVKPRVMGAPTPQQLFEAEQHRKAAEEKRTRGQKTLTSAGSRKLSEFGIGERGQRYYLTHRKL